MILERFVLATEEDPFGAETSCSRNKRTRCIALKNHSPFYRNPLKSLPEQTVLNLPMQSLPVPSSCKHLASAYQATPIH